MLDGSSFGGLGGVVKNVLFTDITMTNVTYPIIINSWYINGDKYGLHPNTNASALHTLTSPGETLHTVDQQNNGTAPVPFYDNIRYTNITATGSTGKNVAIIYGLDSQPANPGDPQRNIDNVSFNNVHLSGSYGADLYYASRLDLSGLSVNARQRQCHESIRQQHSPARLHHMAGRQRHLRALGRQTGPTRIIGPRSVVPNGVGKKVGFGNQDSSNNIVDMVSIAPKTVGCISFSADTSTTIQSSGGYSLTLDNNVSTSIIDVAGQPNHCRPGAA